MRGATASVQPPNETRQRLVSLAVGGPVRPNPSPPQPKAATGFLEDTAGRESVAGGALPREERKQRCGSEDSARRARWALMPNMRKYTPHVTEGENPPVQKKCRFVRRTEDVTLMSSGSGAHIEGLVTCKSVWECPCCSHKVRMERATELDYIHDGWRADGGHVYMATLTLRHGAHMPLSATLGGLMAAWRALQQGRAYRDFRRDHAPETVRVVEVTHGAHGWHPHLHVLFFVRHEVDALDVAGWLHEDWRERVVAELGEECAPIPSVGTDFREAKKADYLAKIGLELANPANTKATCSPWEFLRRAHESTEARRLWQEYARTCKGRRAFGYSRGLKPYREQAKSWAEADASEDESVPVYVVPGRAWDEMRHTGASVLSTVERIESGRESELDATVAHLRSVGSEVEWKKILASREWSRPPDVPPGGG